MLASKTFGSNLPSLICAAPSRIDASVIDLQLSAIVTIFGLSIVIALTAIESLSICS